MVDPDMGAVGLADLASFDFDLGEIFVDVGSNLEQGFALRLWIHLQEFHTAHRRLPPPHHCLPLRNFPASRWPGPPMGVDDFASEWEAVPASVAHVGLHRPPVSYSHAKLYL